jgi:ABC-type transport system involved in multi-copper enzyme maturation permease subunit
MKKQIFLIIFIFLFIFNFALAQIFYFSSKNSSNGLMIGVEVFNQKTKSSITPLGYIYEWTLPDISLEPQKTNTNLFFTSLPKFDNFLFLNLKITKPFSKETYFVKNQKIFLSEPKVKIVRKTQEGILLPLSGKLKKVIL